MKLRQMLQSTATIQATDTVSIAEGVAVVYNALSEPLKFSNGRTYHERFLPGAFTASLAKGDIICTVDHDLGKVLGRKTRNTLTVIDSPENLRVSCELPMTTYARDLVECIKRGDIQGMSFTFNNEKEDWTEENGLRICTVTSADIHEVCFSSLPCYTQTSVGLRNWEDLKFSKTDPKSADAGKRFRMLALGLKPVRE